MAQTRQITAQIYRHSRIVEAAEGCGHDEHLALGELQHEAKLALAEHGHERITDGTKLQAGEMQHGKFPPIRQLKGDDVAAANAEPGERECQHVGETIDLFVAQTCPPSERIATIAVLSGVCSIARSR